jgi:hypothetical protein
MSTARMTYPDIAYAVGSLCLYATAPTTGHWLAAKCVLRYLAGTPMASIGMIYKKGRDTAEGFSNTDYAADVDMQHGCTVDHLSRQKGGVIMCSSKPRAFVATLMSILTCEAEYIASAASAKSMLWTRICLSGSALAV